jgi:hypothetical protein
MSRAALAATIFLAAAGPAMAQGNPSQLLQGLLSGNQGQDQAVRDAFERGYRQGRQDQQRADRDDRGAPPPDRNYQGQGYGNPGPGPGYGNGQQRGGYTTAPPAPYSR